MLFLFVCIGFVLLLGVVAFLARGRRRLATVEEAEEVARDIESLIDGTAQARDWDDFMSTPVDTHLDEIREKALATLEKFGWGSADGNDALQRLAQEARQYAAARRTLSQNPSLADN